MRPPKDNLWEKISQSKLSIREGDIIIVSSKVVSIGEGRTVPIAAVPDKDVLIKKECERYVPRTPIKDFSVLLTLTNGFIISASGIDESNANGHYILWPKNPMRSAARIRQFLMREYRIKKLGVIITDSHSTPLRRGAIGFALGYAGISPLSDYRGTKDLFGRVFKLEQANLADALAAAAVSVMGEGAEQTPVVRIRNAPSSMFAKPPRGKYTDFIVPPEEDLYSVFLNKVRWMPGGRRQ